MARTGWSGRPPSSDDEARRRIVEAAMSCVDRHGTSRASLSDVASELGVTRQTVYRYFGGTDELFAAVARAGADAFIDQLSRDLAHLDDPCDAVVEAVATVVRRLPQERYLGLVLTVDHHNQFFRGATSPEAMALARRLFDALPVAWHEWGVGERELDLLAEFGLRMIESLVLDPATPRRDPRDLRDFLRYWLRPVLALQSSSA